jgi:hypothetical protein
VSRIPEKGNQVLCHIYFLTNQVKLSKVAIPLFSQRPQKGKLFSIFSKIIPWMKTEQPIDEINSF